MRTILLFDLDGTLTDSGKGIMNSVSYALEKFNIRETDPKRLRRFVGPPLKESFLNFYGFSEEEGERAVAAYREYFTEKGIKENKLYPGIREGLTALKGKGFWLGIASSKPEVFVEQIARDFQITEHFDVMAGSLLDGGRTDKAQVIEEALRRLGASPEQTVMVGDREHDVKGAACLGIPCAGAVYGYGSREELIQAGAHWLLEEPGEIGCLDEMIEGKGMV